MSPTIPQRLGRFLVAVLLFAAGGHAAAQVDTAEARRVFAEVNISAASMNRASFKAKRPDVEYTSEVKAWADVGGVRKLEVTDRDDDGDVVTEYYYANSALVFVFQTVKGYKDGGKQQVTRNEDRQYFRDGKMFKWLGGLEKADNPPAGVGFADEAKMRLGASAFYINAANQVFARGPAGKGTAK